MNQPAEIIRLLFPRRCALCDDILPEGGTGVCRKCRGRIHFLKEPLCCRCGRPVAERDQELCGPCRKTERLFEAGFAPFLYSGSIRQSLLRFKYGHRAEYASFYAEAVAAFGKSRLICWRPELIVPIPVYRTRAIRRGYNQASETAEKLSALTGIPWTDKALVRIRQTKPQKELGPEMRRRNLKQAFAAGEVRLPQRILLVDDIFTTGSTIDAAAEKLMESGAEKIWFACISISPGES